MVFLSLSLSRIDFPVSENSNPRWQKFGSSSRNLSHAPFTSPFSRASLRDGDSGGFLLFSCILFSRNEAACDDILPPFALYREEDAQKIGLGFQEKNTHTLLSLSLSLYFHHHPSHDEHETEHREEGCLEEQQQHGREERGVVGGDHRHHLFFRRRVGGRHRRRVRRHLRQGPRRFWRQIAAKTSG